MNLFLFIFSLSFDLLAWGLGDCSLNCEKLKIIVILILVIHSVLES